LATAFQLTCCCLFAKRLSTFTRSRPKGDHHMTRAAFFLSSYASGPIPLHPAKLTISLLHFSLKYRLDL
ncbi:MAG: hypothetical protein KBF27_07930, partial [Cypionkella sp.]|nr:hypothetical protein [Cypionkella sp.]